MRIFRDDRAQFKEIYPEHRGLHYQAVQSRGRLVRVLSGAVLDVAVDLRPSFSTFGKHVPAEISAENALAIRIPAGAWPHSM